MKKINKLTLQKWLPIKEINKEGVVKLKNNKLIKIIKVNPINYNLKSNLEKESILNSYKIFLKTCNFNIQILIQSNKEDLNNHISGIIFYYYFLLLFFIIIFILLYQGKLKIKIIKQKKF